MDQNVSGVLSNWDRIEATIRSGIHTDPGQSKDVQDILDIIHSLQDSANIVSPLRDLFMSHMTNDKNPHQVNVSISDLDMLQFLYDRYIESYGILMTFSEFCIAVLNMKRFATRSDVDNNINLDSVVNLDVLNYVVTNHDEDEDAHANLFRHKLPGIPLSEPPSFVLEPNIGIAGLISVDRQCGMCFHDINGRVRSVAENVLPVDYLYGLPSIPIFGDKRNILTNSESLNGVTVVGGTRDTSMDTFIITPTDRTECLVLKESTLDQSHGFIAQLAEELTGVMSYSVYVYPLNRTGIRIVAINSAGETIYRAKYDLIRNDATSFDGSTIMVEILPLPSGWVRCNMAFDSSGKDIVRIRVDTIERDIPTDLYGVAEYLGNGQVSAAFWQHQLTEGPLTVPPIITLATPVSILGTKISKPFSDQFNHLKGTVHAKFISPVSEIFDIYSSVLRIGHNDQDNPQSTIEIDSNPIAPYQYRITSYNANNDILSTIASEDYAELAPQLLKRIEFSYTRGYQGYGFTNQSPKLFRHYAADTGGTVSTYDESIQYINDFFTNIYDGDSDRVGTVMLQQSVITLSGGTTDNGDILLQIPDDLEPEYRMNDNVSILEIGYNSLTDKYLEGYMLNFRYYSVFANKMNLEFLLDQYIPET